MAAPPSELKGTLNAPCTRQLAAASFLAVVTFICCKRCPTLGVISILLSFIKIGE